MRGHTETKVPAAAHTPEQILDVVMVAINWLEHNPERWTRGIYARNKNTGHVDPHSPEAHCFCTLGRIALEADIFVHQLGRYLAPIGVDQLRVIELNDRQNPDPDKIRAYFKKQYEQMKECGA